ncbi:hypothetical protein IPG36_00660 [bacterium]|nr:MAG: hypothetical protein IPG36_00660 [bacterium]
MPPDVKQQIYYARMNRMVLRYIKLSVVVVLALAGVFGWALRDLSQTAARVDQEATDKQATITSLNKSFTPKAKEASDRLAAVAYVYNSQTRFSAVIEDLAKVVPQGVAIDTMTLTGDDKQPVRIGFSATTYQAALAFRDALMTSPRVAAADLENITSTTSGAYTAAIIVGFNKGQAK